MTGFDLKNHIQVPRYNLLLFVREYGLLNIQTAVAPRFSLAPILRILITKTVEICTITFAFMPYYSVEKKN